MSFDPDALKRAGAAKPPHKVTQKDVFHGTTIHDPYRHLEDLDAKSTLEWTGKQHDRFNRYISGFSRRKQMQDKLKEWWDYPYESLASRYDNRYFQYHNPGLDPQETLRVKDGPKGKWRTLIDPNTMSKDGTVALSGISISPNGKYVAYLTSDSGSDAQTLRVRDVATGKDLSDHIDNCRFTSIVWDRDSDDAFTYSYPAPGDEKRFVLKHHKIGAKPEDDPQVFELAGVEDSFVSISRPKPGDHEWVYTRIGTDPNTGILVRKIGDKKPFRRIFAEGEASYSILGEANGKVYMTTNKGASRRKLVRFDLSKPEPEHWETIIPEHKSDLMGGAFMQQGKLFVNYSHDTADQLKIFDLEGKPEGEVPLPIQSTYGMGRVNEEDTTLQLKISSFKTPGEVWEYDIKTGKMELREKSKAPEDMSDCIVERIHAKSKDGTMVPMTVIRAPGTKLDGSAATMLYGYGGFNVPLEPGFSKSTMNWVRNGGIYVQANLRGGGEFGKDWYDGGRLLNKQNVFDDLHACAEHLAAKKYTSAKRLVIKGGSNGGLLTAACLLQRPELYGAAISAVPVLDMLRFHKHTYGAAWKSDYGDVEGSKADFEAALKYSPLHNVGKGAKYPPLLVATADHDDRVVPSHAFKFVATMLEKSDPGNTVLMRVEKSAGHGAGKPTEKVIEEIVDQFAFIENAIGPVNQATYQRIMLAKKKLGKDAKKPDATANAPKPEDKPPATPPSGR